jgi:hypothetical protein
MTQPVVLTITSLISLLLLIFHLTDDIVRGFEPGGLSTIYGVLIGVVWLYATVALAGRRSGNAIILLGSILASGVPVIHMTGAGMAGGRIANSTGMFFFVWTLIALGVTTVFTVILAAQELWRTRRSPARAPGRA